MEIIQAENLLDEVKDLSPEQRIFVGFPENVRNRLELLSLQIKSAENLFQSYINSTSEIASELNLTKFLNLYTDLAREKDELFRDTVIKCLGTEVYSYIICPQNGLFYMLDSRVNKLVIGKRGLKQLQIK